jgi:ABC-type glycerol-3-phosphate transport system permease component
VKLSKVIFVAVLLLLSASLLKAKTLTVLLLANASTQDVIQNFFLRNIAANILRTDILQISLANLIGTNTVEWGTSPAYATLAVVPVFIVFLCFQRYFLKGSLSGGVKG